jgi:CheY-like chemotaxis protein
MDVQMSEMDGFEATDLIRARERETGGHTPIIERCLEAGIDSLFVEAINYGRPEVHFKPTESVCSLLEDFAFYLSRDEHKRSKPAEPTETWK